VERRRASVRKLIVGAVTLVAALVFTVSGALGSEQQTPGITAKKILIGGTFPLTGPLAGYAPVGLGMRTYFSYINGRRGRDGKRGIMGRQVEFKIYDDPTSSLSNFGVLQAGRVDGWGW